MLVGALHERTTIIYLDRHILKQEHNHYDDVGNRQGWRIFAATSLRREGCGADGKWARYGGSWYSPVEQPADLRAVLTALDF